MQGSREDSQEGVRASGGEAHRGEEETQGGGWLEIDVGYVSLIYYYYAENVFQNFVPLKQWVKLQSVFLFFAVTNIMKENETHNNRAVWQ